MLKMYTPVEQDRSHAIPPSHPPPLSTPYPPPAPMSTAPADTLAPVSTIHDGRIWSLHVVQQPIRARMCGFGDKDRRPITPPPCIQLIVRDAQTEEEIDINEIDTSFYVLTVDLWDGEGHHEVNLVRHSATSPSISTAISSSYPPPPQNVSPTYPPYGQNPYGQPMYPPMPPYNQQMPYANQQMAYPNQYATNHPQYPYPTNYYPQNTLPGHGMSSGGQQTAAPAPGGMFTRNLIGSLSASAFRLTDPDGKVGVWFILQDLSVRTEGTFRLKINFVNVGTNSDANGAPVLNHGSAPVLASVFSEPFQVYSAKKFPGVIESTPLSKCFALQGIKIPIRKDALKGGRGQGDGGDDDDYD